MNLEEVKKIIETFRDFKEETEKINLLEKLEIIYNAVFQDNEKETAVVEKEKFKSLINPLTIDEFFKVYKKVRGFAIVEFQKENGEKIYGLQKKLIENDIKAVKTLIACKELDNPELAEKLYFEMERIYNQVISIVEGFYDVKYGEYEFGLTSRLATLLKKEISDYFG